MFLTIWTDRLFPYDIQTMRFAANSEEDALVQLLCAWFCNELQDFEVMTWEEKINFFRNHNLAVRVIKL